MTQQPIVIRTDGSCETETRLGGWAAILTQGEHRRVIQGSASDTTVNAMELTAVIEALSALKQPKSVVQVLTDSNYVAKGVSQWLAEWIGRGWKNTNGKTVANLALWQQLKALLDQHQVTVTWIPREQNTEVDGLAQAARMAQNSTLSNTEATDAKPTGLLPAQPPVHLMISGSMYASGEMLSYTRRLVQRAHQLGYTIVVGDNPKGVDMVAVQECRRLKAKVIVVGVTQRPRNGGCAHGEYVQIERDTYRGAKGMMLNRFTVRDRAMADMSQLGVFVWNNESKGTKQAYEYMLTRGKEAHLKTFVRGVRHG